MYSLQEKIIAHFIFSNEQFIAKLTELHQLNLDISNNLFKRLGVQEKRDKRVTMLVISDDSFAGFDTLFTLAIACEKAFKKSVDTDLMRVVVFRTLDEARKSSHLEHANFIFIPDENLLDVESYPELEKILPFKK